MTVHRSGVGQHHLPVTDRTPARRSVGTSCAFLRCKTKRAPIIVGPDERYCDKHATRIADGAFGDHVRTRDPRCVACGRDDIGVQCAHVVTRGARFIRWDAENAVGLCARCHFAYTKRPAAWLAFVEREYPGRLQRLLRRENHGERIGGSVDVAEVIRGYRAGVAWSWPDPPPVA